MSSNKKLIYTFFMLAMSHNAAAQTCQTDTIQATTPSSRFTVLGNGTVKDNKTGLEWKQCIEGLSGHSCTVGIAAEYTWQGALQLAQATNTSGGFAGHSDWRVPKVGELWSITELQCYKPSINANIFPNTPYSNDYWTSSLSALDSDCGRIMSFVYGKDNYVNESNCWNIIEHAYVRLVR